MSAAETFADSNVLLYLISGDAAKAARAEAILRDGVTISVQVLNEFAAVAARKTPRTWDEIVEMLAVVRAGARVLPLTTQIHDHALRLARRYGYRFYDCAILGAALEAGCATVYSEDMQDGQVIDGRVTIRNPFAGL